MLIFPCWLACHACHMLTINMPLLMILITTISTTIFIIYMCFTACITCVYKQVDACFIRLCNTSPANKIMIMSYCIMTKTSIYFSWTKCFFTLKLIDSYDLSFMISQVRMISVKGTFPTCWLQIPHQPFPPRLTRSSRFLLFTQSWFDTLTVTTLKNGL